MKLEEAYPGLERINGPSGRDAAKYHSGTAPAVCGRSHAGLHQSSHRDRGRRLTDERGRVQGVRGGDMAEQPWLPATWDRQADVVVVGFGAAGAATAITAYEAGAQVLLLEKAPYGHEGGNTRVAGQGYLNTSSVEKASPICTRCVALPRSRPHGTGVGGGNVPEQCLGREHRWRPAGASASTCWHRVSELLERTVCTSSTMGLS